MVKGMIIMEVPDKELTVEELIFYLKRFPNPYRVRFSTCCGLNKLHSLKGDISKGGDTLTLDLFRPIG